MKMSQTAENLIIVSEAYPTWSIRVDTPDGRMFVHILEKDESPTEILIQVGKSGSNLNAWCEATARMASKALPSLGIHGIIEELSGITSQGFKRLARGEVIRSGPEGICYALLRYKQEKFRVEQPKRRYGRASTD